MRQSKTVAALVLLLAGTHPARAAPATIEGDVRDSLGRPIAGAAIVLEGADGRAVARATGDSGGHFVFGAVPAGTYAIVADKENFEEGTAIVSPGPSGKATAELVLPSRQALDMAVIARKLNEARNELSPETGSSAYTMDSQAIAELPQGGNTSLNQVLLQAPGIAEDSAASGNLHIRGEHANLQYRINGIVLPEGISGFGPVLDSHIVDSMQLLTGTLPAQYGDHTAGIVDIHTRSGAFEKATTLDMSGGSHDVMQPSLTTSGTDGKVNYFLSGNVLSSNDGMESPTDKINPIHDHSTQGKGFGYVDYLLNPTNRLDVIFGTSVSQYQIPNNPGQSPGFAVAGAGIVDSASLTESQTEQTHYATIALQGTSGEWGYQLAPYLLYSQVHFRPDPVGDLEYNGVAADVLRADTAVGLQADGSVRLGDRHTLRAGIVTQHDAAAADNSSSVLAADANGNQTADTTPFTITDNHHKESMRAGIYLQDEWKLTDRLTMNYGARFDQLDAYVDENQLSPRLGFVYKPTDSTTLHAGYARTFTPPPLELISAGSVALFNLTTAASAVQQSDPVKAERANSFDAGITQKLGDHWQVGLDGYDKFVKNLLDEGQFGQALVLTPFNYAKGKIYGLEATASYTADKLTGYANFAASRALGKDIISGQTTFGQDELDYISGHWVHLDHDQTFTGSAGLSYQVLENTKASADAVIGSGLRNGFANTGHLPLYDVYNLGLVQHVPIDANGVDVRFAVLNVLDSQYELRDGTGIGVGAPQWGARRAFTMGLSRTF